MGKLLVWIMILGSVASSVAAQKRSDPFFFIQLSDPQLGFIDDNRSYARETELMELFTDAINRLRPAFVVVTGDMVHDLNDAGQVAEFDRLIARIDPAIPVYFTPGNHDVGNEARDRLVEAYIKKYGYDRFAFAHRGAYLIGLNTPVVWADCPDRERKQWRWLAAKLKRSRRYGRTIVLGHHPFFLESADEKDRYENIPSVRRGKYLDLFARYGVDCYLSGHLHFCASGSFGGVRFHTAGAATDDDYILGFLALNYTESMLFIGLGIDGAGQLGKAPPDTAYAFLIAADARTDILFTVFHQLLRQFRVGDKGTAHHGEVCTTGLDEAFGSLGGVVAGV